MWINYLENKEPILKTYGKFPLNPLRILGVLLDERNVHLQIRADLPEFPQDAPKKWIEQEANTIQIKLDFWFCTNIIIRDFSIDNIAELTVEKDDLGNLTFNLGAGNGLKISGNCKSIHLQNISAYQNQK